jgi:acyl-homoserine lactone acylase PvdQ
LRVLLARTRGRAAEKVGEKEIAIDSYTVVADAWQNADADLMPMVEEARAALRRLGTDEKQPRVLKL